MTLSEDNPFRLHDVDSRVSHRFQLHDRACQLPLNGSDVVQVLHERRRAHRHFVEQFKPFAGSLGQAGDGEAHASLQDSLGRDQNRRPCAGQFVRNSIRIEFLRDRSRVFRLQAAEEDGIVRR